MISALFANSHLRLARRDYLAVAGSITSPTAFTAAKADTMTPEGRSL